MNIGYFSLEDCAKAFSYSSPYTYQQCLETLVSAINRGNLEPKVYVETVYGKVNVDFDLLRQVQTKNEGWLKDLIKRQLLDSIGKELLSHVEIIREQSIFEDAKVSYRGEIMIAHKEGRL